MRASKRAGRPRRMYIKADGSNLFLTIQCFENRHMDCTGETMIAFMTTEKCKCDCHKLTQ